MYYTYKSWVLYRTIAGHYTYDYSVAARFIRTSQKSKFHKTKTKAVRWHKTIPITPLEVKNLIAH